MTATATGAPPAGIEALAERFDPDVIDVPGGHARIRLATTGGQAWDAVIRRHDRLELQPAREEAEPDALITADEATWRQISADLPGGMDAFSRGRLRVRRNLHLGVGFLAATSGATDPGRLTFETVRTRAGRMSILAAGRGPTVLCIHGLGGTKVSFLHTVAALADSHRVISVDLPGFGDSGKPIAAPYDSEWFARSTFELLDALEIDKAHFVGNSMGGRVSIEAGFVDPDRVDSLVLLSPALAWLADRRWTLLVKALRPELGLLQITPRGITDHIVRRLVPAADDGWAAAGVDEFLRAYLTPRGRAAFYASARNIYLDEPHGDDGFWTRLAGLAPDALFVWGRHDPLVPIGFMKHVERALPAARHVELECGHVPQIERPYETHQAMRDFFTAR